MNQNIKNVKKLMLQTAQKMKIGHLPSSFSSVEILWTLYNKVAKITPQNAKDKARDRVIISKEHCRLAQVCVLAECGLLNRKCLDRYMTNNGLLGHDMYGVVGSKELAAIDVSSGSLGHGPSVGVGMAWNSPYNVYVLTGDGELQEGSIWEAIMFAGHHKMSNFTLVVDRNFEQIDNYTKNIIDTSSNLSARMKAFDFEVFEVRGGVDLLALQRDLLTKTDKPKCVVVDTVKGKDILFAKEPRGSARFHWETLTDAEFERAMKELDQ